MKFVLLIFSFTLFNNVSKSQNFTIVYRHCFQPDTTKILTDTIGKEAKLIGNGKKSVYTLKKIVGSIPDTSKISEKNLSDLFNAQKVDAGSFSFKSGIPYDSIGDLVLFDKIKDSIFVREKMVSVYALTSESNPNIQWTLTSEKKQIQNYECLKATCTFRGRNYIVWFAPKIAIPEGPWKFKGLPGLILSIEDDKELVKIYAVSINFPSSDEIPKFSAIGNRLTLFQYYNFKNIELNGPIEALKMLERAQEGYKESMFAPIRSNRLYMLEMHD